MDQSMGQKRFAPSTAQAGKIDKIAAAAAATAYFSGFELD